MPQVIPRRTVQCETSDRLPALGNCGSKYSRKHSLGVTGLSSHPDSHPSLNTCTHSHPHREASIITSLTSGANHDTRIFDDTREHPGCISGWVVPMIQIGHDRQSHVEDHINLERANDTRADPPPSRRSPERRPAAGTDAHRTQFRTGPGCPRTTPPPSGHPRG